MLHVPRNFVRNQANHTYMVYLQFGGLRESNHAVIIAPELESFGHNQAIRI
jgi:hypothetical protein